MVGAVRRLASHRRYQPARARKRHRVPALRGDRVQGGPRDQQQASRESRSQSLGRAANKQLQPPPPPLHTDRARRCDQPQQPARARPPVHRAPLSPLSCAAVAR
eukprot:4884119-Prymnesium_polylepis.1